MHTLKTVLLTCCLTLTNLAYPATVIFDAGNVLVRTSKRAAFWHTGPRAFLRYLRHKSRASSHPDGTSANIRYNVLFAFLEKVLPYRPDSPAMYDESHVRIPQPMVDWMTGRLNSEALRALIAEAVVIHPSWFKNAAEKRLVKAMTSMMFSPTIFAHTQKLIPESVEFVQKCVAEGHRVFILSNWDAESFPILMKQNPEFFDLFEGIVVSGATGYTKPDPTIYQHLIQTYKLNPTDCIFIDDVEENIQAAQKFGITALHCEPCKIKSVIPEYEQFLAERLTNNSSLVVS